MYVIPPISDTFQQGDIFNKIPFISLSSDTDQVLMEEENVLALRALDLESDSKDFRLVVNGVNKIFMAVSQTCDLQRRDYVSIAPIFDIVDVGGNSKQESIRRHKVVHQFYLYPTEDFPESFVDFSRIMSVPLSRLNLDSRLASLDTQAQYYLADRLKQVYGRPVEPPKPNYLE